MGAHVDLIIYMETQSSAKNGTHQKWLHEALIGYVQQSNMTFICLLMIKARKFFKVIKVCELEFFIDFSDTSTYKQQKQDIV